SSVSSHTSSGYLSPRSITPPPPSLPASSHAATAALRVPIPLDAQRQPTRLVRLHAVGRSGTHHAHQPRLAAHKSCRLPTAARSCAVDAEERRVWPSPLLAQQPSERVSWVITAATVHQ